MDLMVRRFKPEDFESIASWAKARGDSYDKDLFPPLGFIFPGVCAYFIYQTDSKVCWLENLVSNPLVIKEARDIAIELVISEVLREVQSLGYKVAYATTDLKQVVDRAKKHKARAIEGQTLLTLAFK